MRDERGRFIKGIPSFNKGKKASLETRIRIKEARKKQQFSKETRLKMSIAHKGERCHWWKGGKAKLNKDERNMIMAGFEYRLWRNAVFQRDNYTCVWCGDNTGGNLEADHIKSWKDYPALRFAIDNGRTLCKSCHRKTDNYGRKK